MLKIILIALFLISSIFYVVGLFAYRRLLNQKEKQIRTLTTRVAELENNLHNNERRKSFRLQAENIECEFRILKIGSKKIDSVKGRIGLGKISDLSFTGVGFESSFNLPIRDEVKLEISFELDNRTFVMKGLLVRKEEHISKKNYSYGLKYIEIDFKSEALYNKHLRAKELESRKIKNGRTVNY